jgi:hypothetical protein
MKVKLLDKKDKDKPQETKQKDNILFTEDPVEVPKVPKKESNIFHIPGFQQFPAMMKLRVIVTILFLFLTVAFILIFMNGYMFSAVLILLSYILLFVLMIKLFRTKKL